MSVDKIEAAGLVISVLTAAAFCFLAFQHAFSAFQHAVSNENLVDITRPIGREVSWFMWNRRSIDLIAQAFVLFVAATACLAILRRDTREAAREESA